MHGCRVKTDCKRGFTLLEIMISMFIFGIIITTVFASYRSVFFKTDKIDTGLDFFAMAGSCLNRIALDLNGVAITLEPEYSKPELDSSPDPYRVVGDVLDISGANFSRLRLASRSHAGLNSTMHEGIAEIMYYVEEDQAGDLVLRRSDHLYPYPLPKEEIQDPILCEKVKSLVFTYYDLAGEAHEMWDSESEEQGFATPKSIHIRLEIGREELESLVFNAMLMLPVVREAIE
jgi:general secretion pathway protein J